MGRRAVDDADGFGPFAGVFQQYFSAVETLSRGTPPLGVGFPTDFDAQAFTTQAAAPLKAAARAQLEAMGFVNRRLQACMQVPAAAARCRSPQDLLGVQMTFWRTAYEQYAESSAKIAESWTHALPLSPPYAASEEAGEHDYIDFNETVAAKPRARVPAAEDRPQKTRRVA